MRACPHSFPNRASGRLCLSANFASSLRSAVRCVHAACAAPAPVPQDVDVHFPAAAHPATARTRHAAAECERVLARRLGLLGAGDRLLLLLLLLLAAAAFADGVPKCFIGVAPFPSDRCCSALLALAGGARVLARGGAAQGSAAVRVQLRALGPRGDHREPA